MAPLQNLLFFFSFAIFLTTCLGSTLDLLRAVTDLKAGLETLRKAQKDLEVSDLSQRDPHFGFPGYGWPPFGSGRFPRPRPPPPPSPPGPSDDDANHLSQLIEELGNSLEALILYLKSQLNQPTASSILSPLTTTSAQPSTQYHSNTTSILSTTSSSDLNTLIYPATSSSNLSTLIYSTTTSYISTATNTSITTDLSISTASSTTSILETGSTTSTVIETLSSTLDSGTSLTSGTSTTTEFETTVSTTTNLASSETSITYIESSTSSSAWATTGSDLSTTTSPPTTTIANPSTASSTLTSTFVASEPTPKPYRFNPQASNLNSVYFGQTTSETTLTTVCEDDSIDIITLGFITGFFTDGVLNITMNQGRHCWGPNEYQRASEDLLGLKDCVGDGYAAEIAGCQARGKKVLISAGGVYSNLTIPDEQGAKDLAVRLWNLFLGGTDLYNTTVRPYGGVVLDGFDIDNEKNSTKQYLPVLMSTLRDLLTEDSSKPYYLSAAPQCPRPDNSIPVPDLLSYIDFWNVQFYYNPSCQLNSAGFLDSLEAWSRDLQNVTSNDHKRHKRHPVGSPFSPLSDKVAARSSRQGLHHNNVHRRQLSFVDVDNGVTSPRLLIGTPAFNFTSDPDTGYVDVATYKGILEQVKARNLTNLAGAMFWDGGFQAVSAQDVDGVPTTYAEVVREVLAGDEEYEDEDEEEEEGGDDDNGGGGDSSEENSGEDIVFV